MDAQRTPDELTAENELICEKLLGWKLGGRGRFGAKMWLDSPNGDDGDQWHTVPTPSFTTWADAGLIVDSFQQEMAKIHPVSAIVAGKMLGRLADAVYCARLNPAVIRAAALEYIRSLS